MISCNDKVEPADENTCVLCDTPNRTERIENHVSQFDSNGEQGFLYHFDPMEYLQQKVEFTLCNPQLLKGVSNLQIVRWSGYSHAFCDTIIQNPLVEIESFTVISYCPKPWPELDFEPTLLNSIWQIDHIQLSDTLLYPPCEMDPSRIEFFFGEENEFEMEASVGANGFYFYGRLDYAYEEFILQAGTSTLAWYNIPVSQFEKAFGSVISEEDNEEHYPVQYKVIGTELILENETQGSSITLKAVEKKNN